MILPFNNTKSASDSRGGNEMSRWPAHADKTSPAAAVADIGLCVDHWIACHVPRTGFTSTVVYDDEGV